MTSETFFYNVNFKNDISLNDNSGKILHKIENTISDLEALNIIKNKKLLKITNEPKRLP